MAPVVDGAGEIVSGTRVGIKGGALAVRSGRPVFTLRQVAG